MPDCIIVLCTAINWAVLEDHEQYTRLFAALDRLEEIQDIPSSVADVFRLMALTGARPTKITRCQWLHVNLKTGAITLPPSRHKTGKATGRNRTITLPPVAVEIIARQPPGPPEAYVFPASRGDGLITYRKDWVQKISPAAGLPEDPVPCSLHHSVVLLALGGAQAAHLMAALGHLQLSKAQRYIHVAETVRTELAERAARKNKKE